MLTIHPADPQQVAVALSVSIDMPAVAYVGVDNGELVGSGGLAWGKGRCWLWFATANPKREYARPVLNMARLLLRKARQLGEANVFTVRDRQFATSQRLLNLTGFKLHAIEDGQEVWVRCI